MARKLVTQDTTTDPGDRANCPGAWPITQGVTDVRTVLALIFSWLMPAQGKRRAPAEGNVSNRHSATRTADAPTRRLIISRNAVGVAHRRPAEYLRGEDVALIKPYLIAWEREQERRRQRDRRTAATDRKSVV